MHACNGGSDHTHAINGETTCERPRQAHVREVRTSSDVEAQADMTQCYGMAVIARCNELVCSAVIGWRWHSGAGGHDASGVGARG